MEDQQAPQALPGPSQQEGVSGDDLERDAIALCARLPPAARRALRALMVLGEEDELETAALEAGHVLVRHAFCAARRRGSDAARQAYTDGALATEAAEIDEALRLQKAAEAKQFEPR
jgi:hypothetical protein